MLNEPQPEFEGAVDAARDSADEACADAVIAFAKWAPAGWSMTEDEWRRSFDEPPPTGSYRDGYAAALEGLVAAAEMLTGKRTG